MRIHLIHIRIITVSIQVSVELNSFPNKQKKSII